MIKTCKICGRMYSTLDKECLCAENKRYREALERIALLDDDAFPGTAISVMQRIAREALGTYSQVLTDDERKAVQEHIDMKAHIDP